MDLLITILIVLILIGLSSNNCPPLRPPPNGILDRNCGTRVGNTCRIYCIKNCQLVGNPIHQCLANNTWSGAQTFCVDKTHRCKRLSAPDYGYLVGECNNYVGCVCVFGCNPGYSLMGLTRLECRRNGWSNPRPTCIPTTTTCNPTTTDSAEDTDPQVYCPALQVPINGVMLGNCELTTPGNVCRFSCNPGFNQIGSSLRVCKKSGKWSNRRVLCVFAHDKCPALSPPSNGFFFGSCAPGLSDAKCYFNCNQGYQLIGLSSLSCLSNGVWSASPPICSSNYSRSRSSRSDNHNHN